MFHFYISIIPSFVTTGKITVAMAQAALQNQSMNGVDVANCK